MLEERYRRVKFVAVQREMFSYLASYLEMEGASHSLRRRRPLRPLSLVLGVLRYVNAYRQVRRLIAERGGQFVSYEELQGDPEGSLRRIAGYLGIKRSGFGETEFGPNTSFAGGRRRELGPGEKLIARMTRSLAGAMPAAARGLLLLYEKAKPKRSPLFHRLLKSEYFRQELKDELRAKGSLRLAETLEAEERREQGGRG
jgi:hypothetical protein